MQPIRPSLTGLTSDVTGAHPEPAPANRAERRGKAKKNVPAADRVRDAAGHARSAQGRRVNPIRRTG